MSGAVFVVVGHVNRGKSSIVSTLAADETVEIGTMPGTTRHVREYPMRVADRVLYTLVDTPGFERARQVLAWLRERERATADRHRLVREFLAEHRGSGRFREECELLEPILAGAAILYVVDGSVPFNPRYEAEMEILRWTGQPRMALINPIGSEDHIREWRTVLDQYFSLVRVFDAHGAGFEHRLQLLRSVRELNGVWWTDLDEAIAILEEDRRHNLRESAGVIADLLSDMLRHTEQRKLTPDAAPEPYRKTLSDRFYENLRRREEKARDALGQIYAHTSLEVAQEDLGPVSDDLFDLSTWNRLGLSRGQLTAMATMTGALVGGGVDVAAGGATFLLGALIGGAVGLASGLYAWDRLAEARVLGQPLGGKLLQIGPMTNRNFPWVVLDRALLYHEVIANQAHARRGVLALPELDGGRGLVAGLDPSARRNIEDCFARLRKRPTAMAVDEIRRELAHWIAEVLEERDAGREGAPLAP
ncbi:MAG: GTPase and DUF3482 domain-containing protein [Deltaproteobacteria bacterium]|nr:GTPase and DUF3482 domain-containing protein [Deltaproteobacteria bacterium]